MKKNKTLVSVFVTTYNHEAYIEQCLDSILMQNVNFQFEILINDDRSTDGTREIIQKYQKKYPRIIKPVLQKENRYSEGKRSMIIRYLLPLAKGRYYAICEGDDFWTDDTKLQRQVDYLKSHKEYALVFHPVSTFFEDKDSDNEVFPSMKKGFTVDKLLEGNFIQTNSVMYRARSNKEYKDLVLNVMPGDWYLHLFHAQFGRIGFIDRAMSSYRRHKGGVWWGSVSGDPEFYKLIFKDHIKIFSVARTMYGGSEKREAIINEAETSFVRDALRSNYDDVEFMKEVFNNAPRAIGAIIEDVNGIKNELESDVQRLQDQLLEITVRYDEVIESWSYRIGLAILKPLRLLDGRRGGSSAKDS